MLQEKLLNRIHAKVAEFIDVLHGYRDTCRNSGLKNLSTNFQTSVRTSSPGLGQSLRVAAAFPALRLTFPRRVYEKQFDFSSIEHYHPEICGWHHPGIGHFCSWPVQ